MHLVPKPILRKLGGRYVAGATLDEALLLGKRLATNNYQLTFDILGEAVADKDDVTATVYDYLKMAEAIIEHDLELNMSCKPTQMGLLVNEDLCYQSIAEILKAIIQHNGFLRFEMEDAPTTDATLRVYQRLREKFGNATGCVLQSMLKRTDNDVANLLKSSDPLNVRMVKGIYLEPESIAFQNPAEVNNSFIRNTSAILAGGGFVGAATHDSALVDELLIILEKNPEWKSRCEIQMLLGVGEDLRVKCRDAGIKVRVYIPFGGQWLPYVQRRLRKNPKLARYALLGLVKRKESLRA